MKKRKRKKLLSLSLKISLSSFLILVVLEKIDTSQLAKLLKSAEIEYFFICFALAFCAQVLGALRMRYYLQKTEFVVSRLYAIGMYFIGTLFNIVLPGGIGGDGYKAFYFHKRFKFPWTKTILAIIRGRASGLFFLVFFLVAFAFFYKQHLTFIPHTNMVLLAGLILVFPCYSICARILLKEPVSIQLGALKYSFLVQSMHLFAITCILYGIGTYENITGYILVFLIANIVAVIPISFGGIGLREFTFVTLAGQIGLNSDTGVAASFLFYIMFTSVALTGFVPYLFLKRLDLRELRFQRRINFSKYAVVEDKPEDSPEKVEAKNAYAGD